ncbi:MAG TPA: heme o synthase [Phycisphaerales bacterium]
MSRATLNPKTSVAVPARPLWMSFVEAGKPGITRLVTITSLVGFVLAALGTQWSYANLGFVAVATGLGTALSSLGANTLNEWMERERDARMPRTAHRPLPQARITPRQALVAGVIESVVGVTLLAACTNIWAALVSLACIVSYVAVYTPLKPRSPISTLVGAVPGALPPLIGWCAGAGMSNAEGWFALTQLGGWSLFALMFVWQLPHFLAIAWMYREDYSLGGFKVLAVEDPTGVRTARGVLLWSLLLIPATLLPSYAMPARAGIVFAAFAIVSSLAFLYLAVRFAIDRTRPSARRVFLASIAHLPLLLIVLVAEAVLRSWR